MLFRSNDTATTEIYTLSLHDALPISVGADYEAAVAEHGVRAIPTVIVLETGRVFEGLAPADAYRAAVEDALA